MFEFKAVIYREASTQDVSQMRQQRDKGTERSTHPITSKNKNGNGSGIRNHG